MKKIYSLLLVFLSCAAAQAQFSATVTGTYSAAGVNYTTRLVFSGNKMGYEISTVSNDQQYTTRILPDAAKNSVTIVSITPGGTYANEYPAGSIEADKNFSTDGLRARLSDESKTLGGLNCKKMLVENNAGGAAEVWIAEVDFAYYNYKDILISDYAVQGLSILQLKGIPMEMHVTQEGFRVSGFRFKEYSNSIPADFFNTSFPAADGQVKTESK